MNKQRSTGKVWTVGNQHKFDHSFIHFRSQLYEIGSTLTEVTMEEGVFGQKHVSSFDGRDASLSVPTGQDTTSQLNRIEQIHEFEECTEKL